MKRNIIVCFVILFLLMTSIVSAENGYKDKADETVVQINELICEGISKIVDEHGLASLTEVMCEVETEKDLHEYSNNFNEIFEIIENSEKLGVAEAKIVDLYKIIYESVTYYLDLSENEMNSNQIQIINEIKKIYSDYVFQSLTILNSVVNQEKLDYFENNHYLLSDNNSVENIKDLSCSRFFWLRPDIRNLMNNITGNLTIISQELEASKITELVNGIQKNSILNNEFEIVDKIISKPEEEEENKTTLETTKTDEEEIVSENHEMIVEEEMNNPGTNNAENNIPMEPAPSENQEISGDSGGIDNNYVEPIKKPEVKQYVYYCYEINDEYSPLEYAEGKHFANYHELVLDKPIEKIQGYSSINGAAYYYVGNGKAWYYKGESVSSENYEYVYYCYEINDEYSPLEYAEGKHFANYHEMVLSEPILKVQGYSSINGAEYYYVGNGKAWYFKEKRLAN